MPARGRYSLSSVGSELIWASIVLTTGSTHGFPSSVLKAEREGGREGEGEGRREGGGGGGESDEGRDSAVAGRIYLHAHHAYSIPNGLSNQRVRIPHVHINNTEL